MAGTLRGSIDHQIASTGLAPTRDVFAATVRFLDTHPLMTRIASNGGAAGSAGGTVANRVRGYTGDADYSGEGAFCVYRWDKTDGSKVYVLVQWTYTAGFNTSPGNPGVGNTAIGVGFQFAMRTDGGNPWNGGTANVGTDTKNGSNVWVDGGSTLLVWPRANGPSGSGATIRQYLAVLTYPSVAPSRLHMLADDDHFFITLDQGSEGGYDSMLYFGPYIKADDVTLPNASAALVMLQVNGMQSSDWGGLWATTVGTTAGNTSLEGGAVVNPADGVRSFRIMSIANLNEAVTQPNGYTSGYDKLDIFLRMYDTTIPVKYGSFGKIDRTFLCWVCYTASLNTNLDKSRAVFGSTTLPHLKLLCRWDGVTTPGTTMSTTGVQFP